MGRMGKLAEGLRRAPGPVTRGSWVSAGRLDIMLAPH
jgi:hypothetical protein